MSRVFFAAFIRVALAIVVTAFLVRENYWMAAAVLAGVYAFSAWSVRLSLQSPKKNFAATLDSTVGTTVTFIIIASFGYAGIVHWAIIAPLLIATYLVGYMGLRIGIASKSNAPPASVIETVIMPLLLPVGLLGMTLFPTAILLHQNIAGIVCIVLLILFIGLDCIQVKRAYTRFQKVTS